MKRPPPTIEQAQRIAHVLSLVKVDLKAQEFSWGTLENKAEGKALVKELHGYKPKSGCFDCNVKAANILATLIGLPAYDQGASDGLKARRMAICLPCPARHAATNSCGRLILDALFPISVTLEDGTTFNPCGCFLPAKTAMKHSKCPASLW